MNVPENLQSMYCIGNLRRFSIMLMLNDRFSRNSTSRKTPHRKNSSHPIIFQPDFRGAHGCKLYVEASGAAATAALLSEKIKVSADSKVVALVSGGNIDLEQILEAFST